MSGVFEKLDFVIELEFSYQQSGGWNLLYNDYLNSVNNNHNPFNNANRNNVLPITSSPSEISFIINPRINKLGIVNDKLGILYAYTKRGDKYILLGYCSINQYNNANNILTINIKCEPNEQIRFIYVYPQYPFDIDGGINYNLSEVKSYAVHLKIKKTTVNIVSDTGSIEYLDDDQVVKVDNNIVLNSLLNPFIFEPVAYPEPDISAFDSIVSSL